VPVEELNVKSKVCGDPLAPESQIPSGVQEGEQLPEVVEWKPPTQTQWTVSPMTIREVEVPVV